MKKQRFSFIDLINFWFLFSTLLSLLNLELNFLPKTVNIILLAFDFIFSLILIIKERYFNRWKDKQ